MFDIGLPELLVIIVIALIVLDPINFRNWPRPLEER